MIVKRKSILCFTLIMSACTGSEQFISKKFGVSQPINRIQNIKNSEHQGRNESFLNQGVVDSADPDKLTGTISIEEKVVTGLENLLLNHLDLFKGKRLGVIANQTSIGANGEHIIDLLSKHAKVMAAFGPEHGIKGNIDGGVSTKDRVESGLKIYSIYGSFRAPTPEMLKGLDVLVYDIQDVGVKFYTFISNLFLTMHAAKREGLPIIVLDRPNPIRADRVEGAVTIPPNNSFVGAAPLPARYGMTVGEIAEMFNDESYLGYALNCDLTVIQMKNYNRSMWYDETGLPWTPTSPNIPDLETATVYPGMCLFEGTNFSEGRGTPSPFLMIGAPFVNAEQWLAGVPKKYLRGVSAQPVEFTPRFIPGKSTNPKYKDVECRGLKFTVTDRDQFQPIPLAVALLVSAKKLFPKQFQMRRYMDNLWGNEDLRAILQSNPEIGEILKTIPQDIERFQKIRRKYLIY